jgi:hypothetical protein
MSSFTQSEHEELLGAVAERYRNDGYEVTLEPGADAIPFDLGDYHPDLLARKGGVATIVEVKSQTRNLSFDQLKSLADEIGRHQGWRFVLITGQDVVEPGSLREEEDTFSWDKTARRLGAAQQLNDAGEKAAAYLILWIALEGMMRHQARTSGIPVDRLAPAILIRQLYSQGELTMSEFEAALRCQEVRNRVVHGFPATGIDNAFHELSSLIQELSKDWSSVGGDSNP